MIEYNCVHQQYQMTIVSYPLVLRMVRHNKSKRWVSCTPQVTTSFQQISQRKCPAPYPKDNLEKEDGIHWEQVNEVPQNRIILSPTYNIKKVTNTGEIYPVKK